MKEVKTRYSGLDFLRTGSAICILAMHVYANGDFQFKSTYTENVRHFCADLVFLFMMISSFSLCCGYYDKIKNNTISLNEFYKKRFKRIWPYFFVLVMMEVVISHNLESVVEGFYDCTLVFGFLPYPKMNIVGVGWFIGVVFAFYILFPFFVFLQWSKMRSIITLIVFFVITCLFEKVMIIHSGVAGYDSRTSVLYCMVYFCCGGIIYQFRDLLIIKRIQLRIMLWLLITLLIAIYIIRPGSAFDLPFVITIYRMIVFSLMLVAGINLESKVCNMRVIKYISIISLYIYLSHMVVYRIIEKTHFLYIMGDGILSYLFDTIIVLLGTIILQFIINYLIYFVSHFFCKESLEDKK